MIINAAIQLLPLHTNKDEAYKIIDTAIALISNSKLTYKVCPFETVVEGESETVFKLIQEIQNLSLKHCKEVIINIKIHAGTKDLFINDKLEKY